MFPRLGKHFHSPNMAKYGLQAAALQVMLPDQPHVHCSFF